MLIRKVPAVILTVTLVFSVFLLGGIGVSVANPSFPPPELPPSGYRIYENGTYTVPNLSYEANKYVLTGDVNGSIVIEADDIILDGAGYTLKGEGVSSGVWLQDRTNVTITNLKISNFSQGIRFSHYSPEIRFEPANPNYPTDCRVQSCTIVQCFSGLSLSSKNCTVKDNYIVNNTFGVELSGEGNIFRNNRVDGNDYSFSESGDHLNDVDFSNTIDGKTIRYWINQHNKTVPYNAGVVILKNCSGIRVQSLNLTRGISLYHTTDTEIFGNNITDTYSSGIGVWWSFNISMVGNRIVNCSCGIEEYGSKNNTISNNLIQGNEVGIYQRTAEFDVISGNQIVGNRDGGIQAVIPASHCRVTDNYIVENSGWAALMIGSYSYVARNNISSNSAEGIILYSSNSMVEDNFVCQNKNGIYIDRGSNNTLTSNHIAANYESGIFLLDSASNCIYRNNLMDNNGGRKVSFFVHPDPGSPRPIDGYSNAWDNGTLGNYWSNYKPDGENMAYDLDNNNHDYHPLLVPIEFPELEVPSIEHPELEPTPPLEIDPNPPLTNQKPEPSAPTLTIAVLVAIPLLASLFLILIRKKQTRKTVLRKNQ